MNKIKLICIKEPERGDFTCVKRYTDCPMFIEVGGIYDKSDGDIRKFEDDFKYINIVMEDGSVFEYRKSCFMLLDEYRNNRIDSIL